MKKLRALGLFLIVLNTILYASYDVKIGVYKNVQNLRANIKKIKTFSYRNKIVIIRKGTLYYAHAIFESNSEAKKALSEYKIYFSDAFIAKEPVTDIVKKVKKLKEIKSISKVKKKVSSSKQIKKTLPKVKEDSIKNMKTLKPIVLKEEIVQTKKISLPIALKSDDPVIIKEKLSKPKLSKNKKIIKQTTKLLKPKNKKEVLAATSVTKKLLLNKTFYMCSTFRKDIKAVKVHFTPHYILYDYKFNNGHKVPYTFYGKSVEMELMALKVVHVINENNSDYILLNAMINGIEVDKLRYYYNQKKAEAFAKTVK